MQNELQDGIQTSHQELNRSRLNSSSSSRGHDDVNFNTQVNSDSAIQSVAFNTDRVDNSSFSSRHNQSIVLMAPGMHNPTKGSCPTFPKVASASAIQKWIGSYRFYRASLGYNSTGLLHPKLFTLQEEQNWLCDMWDESRATLGIQYSWAQITLYGDDEFFNILLRVIIHRIGDDRKVLERIGLEASFKQIFEFGFFHADPHPGNLFAMAENKVKI
jgi:hypothetical protein